MDLGIEGRRAAVAAASAGLGLAVARALVGEGVRVAICGRDGRRVAAAVDELGGGAVGLTADVSDPEEAAAFVQGASQRLGGAVDILVANAGGPLPGTPSGTDLDAYRAALDLNALSTIALCRAALPGMRHQRWGRIVGITSVGAREPIVGLAASSTARAAATSFLKALASEVAAEGITVNSVQPGYHDTERLAALGIERRDEILREVPAGTIGLPEGFGAAVAFLCSEPAAYLTGVALPIDGGRSRGLQ